MYNKIKHELYATDRECEICSNQILVNGRLVAVFWLSNVQMAIKMLECTRQLNRMIRDLMPFDLTA